MRHPPVLETERLILRSFQISDAPRVKELAGAYQIYRPTLNIPHPMKRGWLKSGSPRMPPHSTRAME
jgi:[ribosomal protein S5]-alanine N-acetyltransferase